MPDPGEVGPARSRRIRLSVLGGLVLVLGLAASVALYQSGAPDEARGVGFVADGSERRVVRPEDSRSYRRAMEYMGGKSNLLADDIRRYFEDLGWGRPLALLLAAASLAGSYALFRAAEEAPGPSDRSRGSEEGPPQ